MVRYQHFGTEGQSATGYASRSHNVKGCEEHGDLRWKSTLDLYSTLRENLIDVPAFFENPPY